MMLRAQKSYYQDLREDGNRLSRAAYRPEQNCCLLQKELVEDACQKPTQTCLFEGGVRCLYMFSDFTTIRPGYGQLRIRLHMHSLPSMRETPNT